MNTLDECHAILGTNLDSTLEDVKLSYRDLVQIWHPDRFSTNPRLAQKAEEKLKAINNAYSILTEHYSTFESEANNDHCEPTQSNAESPSASISRRQGCIRTAIILAAAIIATSIIKSIVVREHFRRITPQATNPSITSPPIHSTRKPAKESTNTTESSSPETVDIPQSDLRNIICSFPNLSARGEIQNDTDWCITSIVARIGAYPVPAYDTNGDLRKVEYDDFDVNLEGGLILPYSRGYGTVDLKQSDKTFPWPIEARGGLYSARGFKNK